MKQVILALLTAASISAHADVFSDYQAVGQQALAMSKDSSTETEAFVAKIQELTALGYQIMDLHEVKYKECAAQYAQVKSVDAQFVGMTYDQLDVGYHDGKALVAAPKICYKGRSLVIHPYQIAALSIEGNLYTADGQEIADHELNEVIERAGKIKLDLGL